MAVTVTYSYPVSGTTPPTTTQAVVNQCIASVALLDADTQILITHDMQIASADLTSGFPNVTINATTAGTANPNFAIARTNSVLLTITKASAAGSGGTYEVVVFRPFSPTR